MKFKRQSVERSLTPIWLNEKLGGIKVAENVTERVLSEKKAYNKGIERGAYNSRLGHAQSGYAVDRINQKMSERLWRGKGKRILELGCTNWRDFIDFKNYAPAHLTCINISERELEKGKALAEQENTGGGGCLHEFLIMDAHKLDFSDNTFDIVFGTGILHHLDTETAVKEIYRVLKPGGEIIFGEPLGRNPVGKIVRRLTPNARTPDEKPLDKKEFSIINKYFKMKNSFFQLFYVPAGVISKYLFKSAYNPLMHGADRLDRCIEKAFRKTPVGLYYRYVLIDGFSRKQKCDEVDRS